MNSYFINIGMLALVTGCAVFGVFSSVSLSDTTSLHTSESVPVQNSPQDESDRRNFERILNKLDELRDLPKNVEELLKAIQAIKSSVRILETRYPTYDQCVGAECARVLHGWFSDNGELRGALIDIKNKLNSFIPSVAVNDHGVSDRARFDAGTDWVKIHCAKWRSPGPCD